MKRVVAGIIALALALLLLVNVRLHRPGGPRMVQAQLRYLEGALGEGAAEEMQQLFPEGYVFTWSLYGLASARLAGQLDSRDANREHLLSETRRALAAVHSVAGRSVFVAEMDPPYGVFHASWSLYLLAEYVRAAGPANLPPVVVQQFTRACDRFAGALAAARPSWSRTRSRSGPATRRRGLPRWGFTTPWWRPGTGRRSGGGWPMHAHGRIPAGAR